MSSGGDRHSDVPGRANSLSAQAAEARTWLFDAALPFWGEAGVDGDYGFVEHLTLDARPADVDYKRLRVQARQVYVFSHATHLGYPGAEASDNGWRFMTSHGWSPHGGWVRCMGRRGGTIDGTVDLYDQAFALLAIAWRIRLTGNEVDIRWADRTLEAIDHRLASPTGHGWWSEDGADAALLQNPHMHLFEAVIALYSATGEDRFKVRIERLLELFESVLFDASGGTLGEYYADDWRRAVGTRGHIVEPGHLHEWVWLLYQAERVIPGAARRAEALFRSAERFGYDPTTGLLYDEVFDDGSPRTTTHRLWPNTEALKAHLARFEAGHGLDVARTQQITDNIFRRFLAVPQPGTWADQLDDKARPRNEKIPASALYHLFVAFAELLRLEPRLQEVGVSRVER